MHKVKTEYVCKMGCIQNASRMCYRGWGGMVFLVIYAEPKIREPLIFEVFSILHIKDMESKSNLDVTSTYHLQ